jgi:uncharacterized protein (DUF2147 family)
VRQPITVFAAILVLLSCSQVAAAELKEMIGKWGWQRFTIEVSECQGDSICAKVVDGPKNVGMQIFASKLIAKGGDWFGQITHPETKEIYNTRLQRAGSDTWRLDGCTAAKVCLTGELVRVR